MTSQKIDLSIILPAYREDENLNNILPRLNDVIKNLKLIIEIIVVDTEAPLDKTYSVCKKFSVRYIPRKGGNYFGSAVRTGIFAAHGKFILFMDADGSHSPEFIPDLLEFSSSHDVVVASRYIDKGHTENSFFLIWMSKFLNWAYSYILNIPCKDVSNSFKLYKSDDIKQLNLECNNFDIVEEILYKLCLKNPDIKIKEVPFIFKKRMFGETKRNLIVFMATYLWTILKLKFSQFND
jgi:dolichol-phosphate mannosyltransferase